MWVLAYDLSQPDAAVKVYNYTLEQGITVDALVNNAGFGDFGSFWEVDPKRQADLMYLNAMTPVQLTRCFLPRSVCRKFMKKVNG